MRDRTIPIPSRAIAMPAKPVRIGERNMRMAIRATRITVSTPMKAVEKRQPTPLSVPNRRCPVAMIHLPNGGWTTLSGSLVSTE